MKFAFNLATLFALGLSLGAIGGASAEGLPDLGAPGGGCIGPCGAYLVPPPNPIQMRRFDYVPAPAPAPCGPNCANPPNALASPPPCGQAGCGGEAHMYYPTKFYPYWKQGIHTACFPGPGNCYWRRECWYDSFGRRFCN